MDTTETTVGYSFKPFKFELVKPNPESKVPGPRTGHRSVCSSKYLYVYGGYNPFPSNKLMEGYVPQTATYDGIWKFNFATKKWNRHAVGPDFPKEVYLPAVIRRREKLLVYGGTGVPFGLKSSNKLYNINLDECDCVSEITIAGKHPPEPMYGQAIVMNKNNLYTIGGTNGTHYTCDIHHVNLGKPDKVWRTIYKRQRKKTDEFQPQVRQGHEVGFDGENIYVIGGGTYFSTCSLVNIPVFNLKSREWLKITSKEDPNAVPGYPEARTCHSMVQLKTKHGIYVFVMGGRHNEGKVYNDLWQLELSSLQWKLVQSNILPKAVFLHSVALTREGRMCVFGGIKEGLAIVRTNDLYTTWVCIPKLSDICWEAFLHYFPQGVNISKRILRDLKIPTQFIERLE